MSAIEELFRTKLRVKLEEEKRRIAETLISEDAAASKQSKQEQIARIQQAIQKLQSQAGKSKDPQAMASKLQMMKDKLALAKEQMGMIK